MKQRGMGAFIGLALLLGVLAAKDASAADWSIVPSITQRFEYNSNINTTPAGKLSDFISTTSPAAAFNYATEASKLEGSVGISQLLYVTNTGYNHTDQNYRINGQYSVTPRFNISLNTSFISDSTAQQEFLTSGLIITRTPRLSFAVAPAMSYALTERSTAILNYNFNKVTYQPSQNNQLSQNSNTQNFQNYSTQAVSLVYQYLLSERTTLSNTVSGTESAYTGSTNNDYKSLLYSFGVQHNYSANWAFNAAGGVNYSWYSTNSQIASFGQFPNFVSVPTQTQTGTNFSPYISLGATRRWTNLSISGNLLRNQQASAYGYIAQVTSASLYASYTYSERLNASLGGGYSLSTQSSNRSQNQTNNLNVNSQLSYKVTEKLTASSGYSFNSQLYGGNDLSTSNNSNVQVGWLMLSYSYPIHYQK
jgi:hypothetical protein